MQPASPGLIDIVITEVDKALITIFGRPETTQRPHPDADIIEQPLSDNSRQLSARLMRINHAGEVSAQALYQGQALTAKLPDVREAMKQAALEENDHLAWCQHRLTELGARTSLLNPIWYAGSFALGAFAGKVGDKWSLGFVAETERQVVEHLDEHLTRIDSLDKKSRTILAQMKIDEAKHGHAARTAGGIDLPPSIQIAMKISSKMMTTSSYWL